MSRAFHSSAGRVGPPTAGPTRLLPIRARRVSPRRIEDPVCATDAGLTGNLRALRRLEHAEFSRWASPRTWARSPQCAVPARSAAMIAWRHGRRATPTAPSGRSGLQRRGCAASPPGRGSRADCCAYRGRRLSVAFQGCPPPEVRPSAMRSATDRCVRYLGFGGCGGSMIVMARRVVGRGAWVRRAARPRRAGRRWRRTSACGCALLCGPEGTARLPAASSVRRRTAGPRASSAWRGDMSPTARTPG